MRSHFWGLKVPPHSWFVVLFGARGRSFTEPLRAASGIFEDQCAAIAERDFGWSPSGALVEALGLCAGGIPFLIEPVQVRFQWHLVKPILVSIETYYFASSC